MPPLLFTTQNGRGVAPYASGSGVGGVEVEVEFDSRLDRRDAVEEQEQDAADGDCQEQEPNGESV